MKTSMGFLDVLTIVFVVLKLTGYISWSWWWVWAPLWIPFALAAVALVIIAIFGPD